MSRRKTGSGEGATVADLISAGARGLRLRLVAGRSGLRRAILVARVQRPGLALTGYTDYIRYGRIQIMGASELGFLATLSGRRRGAILSKLVKRRISCFIVTRDLIPPAELVSAADGAGIPVLVTPIVSTVFIKQLSSFLDERLATRVQLHAVLIDVFGLGVLVVGESGIGKSECALELVERGHRLVADDVVEVKRLGEQLVGSSPALTRDHMELRGLGVLNVKDLYGVSSIRLNKWVELVVGLERWEPGKEYERLGLGEERYPLLGLELPMVRMPVAPGRNIALLVEVAARNQLLKERGFDAGRRFTDRMDRMLKRKGRRTTERRGPRSMSGKD